MDWISELPDALLLKILSLLPTMKDVVATIVLSKRWQFLWMMVPTLVYDDSYQNIEYGRFSRFVDRSLFLHEAPVTEILHFKLGKICGAEDIRVWIRAANKCSVRELIIEIDCSSRTTPIILPRSLYTECRMLVTLKLNDAILVDVSSSVSFPSLKILSLLWVKYPGDEFVKSLLSNCPLLEDLEVEQCPDDNVTIFTIIVPTLKSLFMRKSPNRVEGDDHGIVIDTPSLECLDIVDQGGGFCIIENVIPKIENADIDVLYSHTEQLLGSITSVKHLYLCLSISKDAYPVGSMFHCLVHLKICTCETEWLNLLICLLIDSPKLQSLKLEQVHHLRDDQPRPCWSEPSSVPECLLSSLEMLEWVKYEGTKEEKEVVSFIFRSARRLKKATISSKCTDPVEKLEMLKELSFFSRCSSTCHLTFD